VSVQAHSTTSLDLSIPITLSAIDESTTRISGGLSASTQGRSKRDIYLIAHGASFCSRKASVRARSRADSSCFATGVCGSLAMILFAPFAILVARFFRASRWFPAHAALNILAALLVVVAFALGVYATGTPHFTDTHTKYVRRLFAAF
jgi:hypothetical protein